MKTEKLYVSKQSCSHPLEGVLWSQEAVCSTVTGGGREESRLSPTTSAVSGQAARICGSVLRVMDGGTLTHRDGGICPMCYGMHDAFLSMRGVLCTRRALSSGARVP